MGNEIEEKHDHHQESTKENTKQHSFIKDLSEKIEEPTEIPIEKLNNTKVDESMSSISSIISDDDSMTINSKEESQLEDLCIDKSPNKTEVKSSEDESMNFTMEGDKASEDEDTEEDRNNGIIID